MRLRFATHISPTFTSSLEYFFALFLGSYQIILYLCPRLLIVRMGVGSLHCGYRTFTNVVFNIRISQIQDQKARNRNVRVRCIIPCSLVEMRQEHNILWRGLTRVAYPGQGNARARMWDKREVEIPTSFAFYIASHFC